MIDAKLFGQVLTRQNVWLRHIELQYEVDSASPGAPRRVLVWVGVQTPQQELKVLFFNYSQCQDDVESFLFRDIGDLLNGKQDSRVRPWDGVTMPRLAFVEQA
jgi:hypothetical protein